MQGLHPPTNVPQGMEAVFDWNDGKPCYKLVPISITSLPDSRSAPPPYIPPTTTPVNVLDLGLFRKTPKPYLVMIPGKDINDKSVIAFESDSVDHTVPMLKLRLYSPQMFEMIATQSLHYGKDLEQMKQAALDCSRQVFLSFDPQKWERQSTVIAAIAAYYHLKNQESGHELMRDKSKKAKFVCDSNKPWGVEHAVRMDGNPIEVENSYGRGVEIAREWISAPPKTAPFYFDSNKMEFVLLN
jgi:hypothetical protein